MLGGTFDPIHRGHLAAAHAAMECAALDRLVLVPTGRLMWSRSGVTTSPADGASFPWKPTITVTATASDPDGSVTKVEFLDRSTTVIGQDTTAPYSFTWRNVSQGSHVLTVRATDNAGAQTTSNSVNIAVSSKR